MAIRPSLSWAATTALTWAREADKAQPVGSGFAPVAVAKGYVGDDAVGWMRWCRRCPWQGVHDTQAVAFSYAERHACTARSTRQETR